MSDWLLPLVWTWPLLLAATAPKPALWWLPSVGALPGLIGALTLPLGSRLELPWLFLGTTLGLDESTRVFLLFTSILWLAAGVYAAFGMRTDAQGGRFRGLFLLAMAGNLWLIVGQDLLSFYVGFAIMGLASYGLVIHEGDPRALHAGKVYLVMALFGEVTLFAALVMIASQTGTITPAPAQLADLDDLTIGLTLLGLGVKAGMVPLHLWLPLAHPAAPVPASAVLSGTMIKVAILGWLRFLPVGIAALPEWGAWLSGAGLLTMFFALPIGLVQRDPKVILAYSSISKMGLLILLLGLLLSAPTLAPVGVAAITLYVAHHGLVKGSLFLGVGLRRYAAAAQPLVLAGMVFLALALAGAPFTSGAVAKYGIKPLLDSADWVWIGTAVAVAALITTLLMVRLIWISVRGEHHPTPGYRWPTVLWGLLITLVALFPLVLGRPAAWPTNAAIVGAGLGMGAAIAGLAARRPALMPPLVGRIPPGDLLTLAPPLFRVAAWVGTLLWRPWRSLYGRIEQHLIGAYRAVLGRAVTDTERGLRQWPVAGALWLGVSGLLLVSLLPGAQLGLSSQWAPMGESARSGEPTPSIALARPERPEPVSMPATGLPPRSSSPPPTEPAPSLVQGPGEAPPLQHGGVSDVSGDIPDRPTISAPASGQAEAAEPLVRAEGPVKPEPSTASPEPTQAPDSGTPTSLEPATGKMQSHCDPDRPFFFVNRLDPGDRIGLQHCVQESSGAQPRLLDTPPLSNELVRLVQLNLRSLGFQPGPIDGIIGPRTRAAIRAFQRAQGRQPSGIVSFDFLSRLQPCPTPAEESNQAWTDEACSNPS